MAVRRIDVTVYGISKNPSDSNVSHSFSDEYDLNPENRDEYLEETILEAASINYDQQGFKVTRVVEEYVDEEDNETKLRVIYSDGRWHD